MELTVSDMKNIQEETDVFGNIGKKKKSSHLRDRRREKNKTGDIQDHETRNTRWQID